MCKTKICLYMFIYLYIYSYIKMFLPGTYLMHEILRYYKFYITAFMLRLTY